MTDPETRSDNEGLNQPEPVEEHVQDDEIIGIVFRRSLIAIAILLGIGLLIWLLTMAGGSEEEVIIEKKVVAPEVLVPDLAVLPDVPFRDVTRGSGIDFIHESGAEGEKMLPETMGSGVAFFDYDNDGDQDIFLVNSTSWPHSDRADEPSPHALYENDGSGVFKDVTQAVGLADDFYGTGVAIGDVDGDGRRDLFIAAVGPNRLYLNRDGGFIDATESAGVAGGARMWGSSPAFADYDLDGDLDLLVPNYVDWTREKDLALNFTLNGSDRAYGPPKQYSGTQPYLYRNNGDGTFEEVSEASSLHVVNSATGSLWANRWRSCPSMWIGTVGWISSWPTIRPGTSSIEIWAMAPSRRWGRSSVSPTTIEDRRQERWASMPPTIATMI